MATKVEKYSIQVFKNVGHAGPKWVIADEFEVTWGMARTFSHEEITTAWIPGWMMGRDPEHVRLHLVADWEDETRSTESILMEFNEVGNEESYEESVRTFVHDLLIAAAALSLIQPLGN